MLRPLVRGVFPSTLHRLPSLWRLPQLRTFLFVTADFPVLVPRLQLAFFVRRLRLASFVAFHRLSASQRLGHSIVSFLSAAAAPLASSATAASLASFRRVFARPDGKQISWRPLVGENRMTSEGLRQALNDDGQALIQGVRDTN